MSTELDPPVTPDPVTRYRLRQTTLVIHDDKEYDTLREGTVVCLAADYDVLTARLRALQAERAIEAGRVQIIEDTNAEFQTENDALANAYKQSLDREAALRAEVARLQGEIATDDQLLVERQRLLDLFDCPTHGKNCIPNAIEEVTRLRAEAAAPVLATPAPVEP